MFSHRLLQITNLRYRYVKCLLSCMHVQHVYVHTRIYKSWRYNIDHTGLGYRECKKKWINDGGSCFTCMYVYNVHVHRHVHLHKQNQGNYIFWCLNYSSTCSWINILLFVSNSLYYFEQTFICIVTILFPYRQKQHGITMHFLRLT